MLPCSHVLPTKEDHLVSITCDRGFSELSHNDHAHPHVGCTNVPGNDSISIDNLARLSRYSDLLQQCNGRLQEFFDFFEGLVYLLAFVYLANEYGAQTLYHG